MNEDQTSAAEEPEPQEHPPPAPDAPAAAAPSRRWSARRTAVAAVAAVVVLVVVGGGGAAVGAAVSHGGSHGVQGRFGPGGPGGRGGPMGRGGSMAAAPFTALHGTFTTSDGNGGYATETMQIGTVSAVTPTSLTVKSDDGYSQTYKITSGTRVGTGNGQITGLSTGDPVTVTAHSDGTALTVGDRSQGPGSGGGGYRGWNN